MIVDDDRMIGGAEARSPRPEGELDHLMHVQLDINRHRSGMQHAATARSRQTNGQTEEARMQSRREVQGTGAAR
jgi:hypothetical protein